MANTLNGSAFVAESGSTPLLRVVTPIACFVFAVLGALYSPYLVSPLIGDWTHQPLTYWWGRYAGLTELTVAVPGLLIWWGLWALYAWSVGARLSTVLISLSALGWLVILRGHFLDWALANDMILLLGSGAAVAGYAATKTAANTPQAAKSSRLGGRIAVTATFGLGLVGIIVLGMVLVSNEYSIASTTRAGVFVMGLSIALLTAWPVGSQFGRAWSDSRRNRSRHLLLLLLIPFMALVPAASNIGVLAQAVNKFDDRTFPEFIDYVSGEVASSSSPPCVRIKLMAPELVHVSWYGDTSESRLEARVPLRWTAKQGLCGVDIERLSFHSLDPPRDTDDSRHYLQDDAALYRLLAELGASAELRKARWHRQPTDASLKESDWTGPIWTATCMIGGITFTPLAWSNVLVIKRESPDWVPFGDWISS